MADCKRESEDQILETIRSGFHQRETLKTRARTAMATADRKLLVYESLLKTCLRAIESGKI